MLARVAASLLQHDEPLVGGGILHIAAESLKASEVRDVIAKVLHLVFELKCCGCGCVYV